MKLPIDPRLPNIPLDAPTYDRTLGIRLNELFKGVISQGNSFSDGLNASLTTNGYQKLPSGLIIQWGVINGAATTSPYTRNLTFPVPFTSACFAIVGICLNKTTASGYGFRATNINSIGAWVSNSNGESAAADVLNWVAVGV